MPTFAESVAPLLPLLRCPVCHGGEHLQKKSGAAEGTVGIPLQDLHLFCGNCATQYPVTEDFIPIMWDKDIQSVYSAGGRSGSEASSTINANVAIYDTISDDYNLYTRREPEIARRMQRAVEKILGGPQGAAGKEQPPRYHLDFGCGPGHVLGWLKKYGLRQIGLDVSLKNLRNARKHTGCLVVCGNACNMPFADGTINIITESSVLHHIFSWQNAVAESLRVCKSPGGIVLDSEPSTEQMAWSPLAVAVFNARFPVYKILSYVMHDKYIFRNTARAKLNLQAEIHNQPGRGFSLAEIRELFSAAGFAVDIVSSPSPELVPQARPDWKSIVLNGLSARNPWNPRYGGFMAIASAKPAAAAAAAGNGFSIPGKKSGGKR